MPNFLSVDLYIYLSCLMILLNLRIKRKGYVLRHSKNHRMACVGRELKDFFQRRKTKLDRVFQRQRKEC